jgi:hypothetical protein
MHTQQEIQFMIPQFPYTVTARDLLDYRFESHTPIPAGP